MTLGVVETIQRLRSLGRSISSDGKQLAVGDGGEIMPELMESLRSHREALIRIFTPPAVASEQEATAEREAIQWADEQPNPEADASLAAFAAELEGEASPFITAVAKAFPGCRLRPLSQAEYEAIGFRDGRQAEANASPTPRQPAARRGEWRPLAYAIELRIAGQATAMNAGEGVQRIVTLDEIADGFDLESMKWAKPIYEPRGMVPVWVRGIHPTFIEPEAIGLPAASSSTGGAT